MENSPIGFGGCGACRVRAYVLFWHGNDQKCSFCSFGETFRKPLSCCGSVFIVDNGHFPLASPGEKRLEKLRPLTIDFVTMLLECGIVLNSFFILGALIHTKSYSSIPFSDDEENAM